MVLGPALAVCLESRWSRVQLAMSGCVSRLVTLQELPILASVAEPRRRQSRWSFRYFRQKVAVVSLYVHQTQSVGQDHGECREY